MYLYSFLTKADPVVMRVPPDAPTMSCASPEAGSTTTVGHMDDSGRFPGSMKLASDAGTPK